ncbi:DNA-processing protein DprA [Actibacterium sp. XHP0104]|uniref:DNA-processing protein DprA n=1 Tax=Actibacterium sp. XHP0104 TaxID=2984335 RepID=UPI0021E95932|nr:DNA-processing protein DprA [Actibacterium sp. XHP0104]MCV2880526.1 DNA-processing protein DprA [Actibacterium sp. XHP0104]
MAWLRLIRSRRVGSTTFHRLMGEHGSAEAALDALPDIARAAGVKDYSPCPRDLALREIEAGREAGARLVAFRSAAYPARLAEISDAPPLIWARGDLSLLMRPQIALVGARNASSLGTRMARSLAAGLGKAGLVCTSGLARGIDTAAHTAALDTGTIAVLAGGIDIIYPAENTDLARQIAERGLLLSEQPPGTTPQARHFPARNRIISGLAQAVIVIEAAARSGSLITARNALDQGREVLAVPGHPMDARASGCNMLIRDGATLVRGTDDVLEALTPIAPRPEPQPEPQRTLFQDIPEGPPRRSTRVADIPALHAQILNRLGPSPLAEDQLIRDLNLPARQVAPELVTLELDGRIARQPGGMLAAIPATKTRLS